METGWVPGELSAGAFVRNMLGEMAERSARQERDELREQRAAEAERRDRAADKADAAAYMARMAQITGRPLLSTGEAVAVRQAEAGFAEDQAEVALAKRRRDVLRAAGLDDGPQGVCDPNLGYVAYEPSRAERSAQAEADAAYRAAAGLRESAERSRQVDGYRLRMEARWDELRRRSGS